MTKIHVERTCQVIFLSLLIVQFTCAPPLAAETSENELNTDDRLQRDAIKQYNLLINELETENGPFDQRLSEPLLALGHTLKTEGAYREAVEIFKRALYITRINEGLYNFNQILILEDIIECDTALHNWDDVDDEYHYLLWVYDKTFTEPNREQLTAIDKVVDWHLTAFNLPTQKFPSQHLLAARELNETAMKMAEELFGESDPQLASRLYKLAMTDYFIAVGIQRGGNNGLMLTDSLLTMNQKESYYMVGKKLVTNIYREGLNKFKRIVTIFSKSNSGRGEAEAMATVYFADWHLLFNKRGPAYRLYREAYEKFQLGGVSEDKIDKFFNLPVILPVENFSTTLDTPVAERLNPLHQVQSDGVGHEGIEGNLEKVYVSWSDTLPGLRYPSQDRLDLAQIIGQRYAYAIFDITDKGWAENIDIKEYNPENAAFKNQAREALWSIQFRPKLVKGQAVSETNYGLYYLIPE